MRLLRAWAPALLAAVLWLLSAGLELWSRRSAGLVSRVVDHLLAPETVPVSQLTAPAPWGAVMAGLSALAVAGACAALLALVRVRRREAPALTAVAAYWMCCVLAGAAVAAVPVVVAVVQALVERTMPSSLADTLLLSAAHWGVVWGWAPALLARLLDRDAQPRSRLGPAVSAALVYVAAAVALVVTVTAADAAWVAAVPSAPEPAPAPTGVLESHPDGTVRDPLT
ncbi:hypothetical protein [Georgenia sp. H159]|uniref:hypothetical protein n=1 Tax=Georgenia sp. H159 TaxID=3076115 RepID=UPI002D7A0AB3|nr:hypothetical protein [Georgenia sp. H159]